MTGKTHILGAVALAECTVVLSGLAGAEIPLLSEILYVAGAAVGGLLPDIDEPESIIGRKLPFVSGGFYINRFVKKVRANTYIGSREEKKRLVYAARDAAHRGVTHYLITWMVMTFGIFLLALIPFGNSFVYPLFFGLIPGGLSHLVLDLVSGRMPVLAPFVRKSFGIRLIRVNGIVETVVVRITLCVIILLVVLLRLSK